MTVNMTILRGLLPRGASVALLSLCIAASPTWAKKPVVDSQAAQEYRAAINEIEGIEGAYGSGLTSIAVDGLNSNYSSLDGVLLDKGLNVLVAYPAGNSENYTLPGSVTQIGNRAFLGCGNLVAVTIHAGLTSLGDEAFGSCQELIALYFNGSAPAAGVDVLAA